MANKINLKVGTNLTNAKHAAGQILFVTDASQSYLYYDNGSSFLNIVPKLLSVANGGTGCSSLNSGEALIGSGTGAVATRPITNNTTAQAIKRNTNLITANTLAYFDGQSIDDAGNKLNSIKYLGIVNEGTWQASVIAVKWGGTGVGEDGFTENGILYGNGTDALQVTSAGASGTLLTGYGSSKAPAFAAPAISWTAGNANGPTLKLKIGDHSGYTATIPSASKDASGIVTTGSQHFAGNKYFDSSIYTKDIYPETDTANTFYNLGAGSAIWDSVHAKNYYIYNTTNKEYGSISTVAGTTSTKGQTILTLGNSTKSNAAHNAYGILRLYSTDNGYIDIKYADSSTSNLTINVKPNSGNLVVSATADTEATSSTTYRIPFFSTTNQKLGQNNGFTYQTESSSNKVVKSILNLGHAADANAGLSRKIGYITFYGSGDKTYALSGNESDSINANYHFYLPKSSDSSNVSGELVYHTKGSAAGTSTRPAYINSTGKAVAITCASVSYGGTGATSFTKYGVLYGNVTDAVQVTTAGTAGQIFAGAGTASNPTAPFFATPSVSWVTEASAAAGPKYRWTINNVNYDAEIPVASKTTNGIVNRSAQTFAGTKTFNDDVYVYGGTIRLGADNTEYVSFDYDKSSDTLTISFP